MPDATPEEHRVVYRAVADFRDLIAQVAAARAEMKALTTDINTMSGQQGSATGTQRGFAQAVLASAQNTAAETREIQQQSKALRELSPAQEERLRHTRALNMLKADDRLHQNTTNDLVREAESIDKVTISASRAAKATAELHKAEAGLGKAHDDRHYNDLVREIQAISAATVANNKASRSESERATSASRAADVATRAAENDLRAMKRLEQETARTATAEANLANAKSRAASADVAHSSAAERLTQAMLRTADQEARAAHNATLHTKQLALMDARVANVGHSGRRAATDMREFGQDVRRVLRVGAEAAHDAEAGMNRVRVAMAAMGKEMRSAGAGGGGGIIGDLFNSFSRFGDAAGKSLLSFIIKLLNWRTLVIAAVAAAGPLIAILGALGGAVLGALTTFESLAGTVLALPGLFAAAAVGVGALVLAIKPLAALLKAVQAQSALTSAGQSQLADTARDASRKVTDAQHAYASAAKAVTDAQFQETRAQQNLTDARTQATRSLQDLETQLKRASLNEQGAILALKQAQLDYRRALADPTATLLDRQQALLAVKNAQADLSDVQVRNTRTQQDYNLAAQRGVEGATEVVSAQKAVTDAAFNTATAQYQLRTSLQDLTVAMREQAAGGSALYKAHQAVQAALENLGPNTRVFAQALLDNYGAIHKLQVAISEGIFTPLIPELPKIRALMGPLRDMFIDAGKAIGSVAAAAVRMVDTWRTRGDFGTLSATNTVIIRQLGLAAIAVGDAIEQIAIAAAPFTQWLVGAIRGIAEAFDDWAKRARNSGAIARFLDDTKVKLHDVYLIVGNLGALFAGLFLGSHDFAQGQLDAIVTITGKWAEWSRQQSASAGGLRTWLHDMTPLLSSIGHFIGQVAKAFATMAADPRNLREAKALLDALANHVLPAIVDVLSSLAGTGLLSNFANGPLVTALKMLAWVLGLLRPVLANNVIGAGIRDIATAMIFLAGASIIARFTGLAALARLLGTFLGIKRELSVGKSIGQLLLLGLDKVLGTNFSALSKAAGTADAAAKTEQAAALTGAATGLDGAAVALNEAALALNEAAVAMAEAAGVSDLSGLRGSKNLAKNAAKQAEKEATTVAGGATSVATGEAVGGGIIAKLLRSLPGLRTAAPGATGLLARGGGLALGATGAIIAGRSIYDLATNAQARNNPLTWASSVAPVASTAAPVAGFLGSHLLSPLLPSSNPASDPAYWSSANVNAMARRGMAVSRHNVARVAGTVAGTAEDLGGALKDTAADELGRLKQAGSWVKRDILDPLGRALKGIGTQLGGLGKFVYDRQIRPVLALLTGTGKWFTDLGVSAQTWFTDHVTTPLINFVTGTGKWFTDLGVSGQTWFTDHVVTPVANFFTGTGKWFTDLGVSGQTWFTNDVVAPVANFFTGVGSWFVDTGIKAQTWFTNNVIAPLVGFFGSLGSFLLDLPSRIESWAENLPLGIGTAIKAANKALGGKASGGFIEGTFDGRQDTHLQAVTPGEFMVRRTIAQQPAAGRLLNALNAGAFDPASLYSALNLSNASTASGLPTVKLAAASATNITHNTTRGGLRVGDITINNPVRERADRSLRRALQSATYLHER